MGNTLTGTNGDDNLFGSPFQDTIDGLGGNDFIQGNGGGDLLIGNVGNDALWSGGGPATLNGGTGDDTYLIDQGETQAADVAGTRDETVVEASGAIGGIDQLLSYCTINMKDADLVNVENVRLVTKHTWVDGFPGDGTFSGVFKALAVNATGNDLDNIMEGTDAGHCTLTGGLGNDTYIVHDLPGGAFADVIVENLNEGTDTIMYTPTLAGQTYSLATLPNVENLTFGGSVAINGVGNAADNVLTGNAGTNTLTGGLGNDTYVIQSLLDKVIENPGEGTDTISTGIAYTLATLPNVENLTLTGTANISGTGNAAVNIIAGNDGANVLDGVSSPGGVGDTYLGSFGSDTYMIHASADTVLQDPTALHPKDGGINLALSSVSYDMNANAQYVNNLTLTGTAGINGTGNALDNTITGNSGVNVINGGPGGNDWLLGGAGNDTLIASGGTCHLDGGTGADTMYSGGGNDQFYVDNAGDIILAGVIGGFDGINSTVSFNMLTNADDFSGERSLVLDGTLAINGTLNNLSDTMVGNIAANILTGGTGDDTIVGGGGADKIFGGDGNDTLTGGSIGCTLSGDNGNDTLFGGSSNDLLQGGAGDDSLLSGGGADLMQGGAGNDVYFVVDTLAKIDETAPGSGGTDTVKSSVAAGYSLVNIANVENLTLTAGIVGVGNTLDNLITGNGGSNTLQGLTGNDTLIGMGGNDTLDGGAGVDTMIGNVGNDVFIVDNALDSCTGGPLPNPGIDTIMSSVTFDLNNAVNVRNLTLTGTFAINGFGDANANALTGNAAFNTLAGGAGSDTYIMDNTTDVILEAAGAGHDLVISTVSFNLSSALYNAQELEDLTLSGNSATLGTGNALDNIITSTGSAVINTLDGGAGNDTYVIDPNDVIKTDASGNDTVVVAATYSILARPDLENITLAGTGNFNATGNANVNILTGNSGNNTLDGGTGEDTYVGSIGNDVYFVDSYDPSITVAHPAVTGDTVIPGFPFGDPGTDLVLASVSYDMSTLAAIVDNLTLTGTALYGTGNALDNLITGDAFDNTLTGLGGNDTFHGGGGTDTMIGGTGNDTYYVDVSSDIITENALEGTDVVFASVNYDMSLNAAGAVEVLTLTGTAISGTGNASDNTITGNGGANILFGGAGNDTIDGGVGADTMNGGTGNDTFIVDNALDVVNEASGEGTADLIKSSVNWTLHASTISEVENLTLTGTAVMGIGNDLVNTITGNGGANTLDGQLGADTMIGGGGFDTYIVDNALDVVIGIGLVMASTNYNMTAEAVSATNLTLTGTATVGTGNVLNNIITTNILVDTVDGGAGNDTLVLHNANDVVLDADGGSTQTDTILIDTGSIGVATSYNMALNATGTRALTITGAGNFDVICNNLASAGPAPLPMGDTITCNSGVNHITGGTGDDTFFVGANDFVLGSGGGSDTVAIAFTLSLLSDEALGLNAHWKGVEDILLTGTAALNATGDTATNTLTGNSGINILNDGGAGGAGDTLIGGGGNDTYFVNNSSDLVDEQHNSGSGTDIVFSSVNFSIGAIVSQGVENLTLTGSALVGIGNDGTNIIVGTSGDNILDGGLGADTMNGGLGNDTYYVDNFADTILDTGGTDTVVVELNNYTLPTNMENATLASGLVEYVINGNALANTITGNALDNTIDGKGGADTMIGGNGNDTYYVDNPGDVVIEYQDTGTLPGAGLHDLVISSINYTIGDALSLPAPNPNQVEDLELVGSAIRGFGNQLNNHIDTGETITGQVNSTNNTLAGFGGSDWLEGGNGNDVLYAEDTTGVLGATDGPTDTNTLDGGLGKDTLYCSAGIDTVVCNPDALTNVDIVHHFDPHQDHILFNIALTGFDPLKNALDDFVAYRQVNPNLEYVYIDPDGPVNGFHFQLALIINEFGT